MKRTIIVLLCIMSILGNTFACCIYLNNVSFVPRLNDSTRLKLHLGFTIGPPSPPFAGFDTELTSDTLQVKLYYDLSGPYSHSGSWRIDTVNLGILPGSIHAIHVLPYSYDTAAAATDTTLETGDTVLLMALVIHNYSKNDKIIRISPNPVKTKLQVTSPSPVNDLRITDLQGRIVKTVEHYDTSVDVSDLPPGLYILQLQVGEQLYTRKFIKE